MRDWVSRAAMALVVLLLLSSALYALSGDQKALVGLKGVYVFVSTMDPETEHLGLSRDQIKTDVELRLRKAGVRVLTEEEWIMTPGEPALCVQVETFFNPADPSLTASFLVKVELKENVTVARGFKTNG